MFRRLAVFAAGTLLLLGCADEPNANEKAEQAWADLAESDRIAMCDGYLLLGSQWVEDLLTDLARTHSDIVVQQEIDAYTDVVVRECLDRA